MSTPTDERYTPAPIVDAVRQALGGTIGLDPCSCRAANKIVKAERFYSSRGDTRSWDTPQLKTRTVFVNPPGSLILSFAERFQVIPTFMRAGAFLAYNWDHSTNWFARASKPASLVVLLNKRWMFKDPEGDPWEVGRSQGVLLYGVSLTQARDAFEGIGEVWRK